MGWVTYPGTTQGILEFQIPAQPDYYHLYPNKQFSSDCNLVEHPENILVQYLSQKYYLILLILMILFDIMALLRLFFLPFPAVLALLMDAWNLQSVADAVRGPGAFLRGSLLAAPHSQCSVPNNSPVTHSVYRSITRRPTSATDLLCSFTSNGFSFASHLLLCLQRCFHVVDFLWRQSVRYSIVITCSGASAFPGEIEQRIRVLSEIKKLFIVLWFRKRANSLFTKREYRTTN